MSAEGKPPGGDEPRPDPQSDWSDLARRGARLFSAVAVAGAGRAGAEIAATPAREMWRDGKVTLSRYLRHGPPSLGPLLILQGLIGRQTITDLEPERSLVRQLLASGADVWVVDWGSPSRADRHLDIADHALFWLGDMVEAIRAETSRKPALLGICQGGVFALCHAALRPEALSGLALAVTPVDFHADARDPDPRHGLLNLWARNLDPGLVDDYLAEHGTVPGAVTGALFNALTPGRTAAKYSSGLMEAVDDAEALATFLRMERWLADRPDHPGTAAREWIVDLYGRNALAKGHFALDGERVDLARVACPVLNIVAVQDHIVPAACARALGPLLPNADYRLLEVPTGHIGVFVSRQAQGLVGPRLVDWLASLAPAEAPRRAQEP